VRHSLDGLRLVSLRRLVDQSHCHIASKVQRSRAGAHRMDWNNLRDQVSNLSLYDVKASIRKVQNGRIDYGSWRKSRS
jgi:hypothetical protein